MNAYATANLSALNDLYSALDPAHVLLLRGDNQGEIQRQSG
jgi:hypothetical protein